jgi:hypothetical protein
MSKGTKTYSFYGSSEIEGLLEEFQRENHIESKSKAIKVLLDAGLRNWSHPQEERETERPVSRNKRAKGEYYELITGSSSQTTR